MLARMPAAITYFGLQSSDQCFAGLVTEDMARCPTLPARSPARLRRQLRVLTKQCLPDTPLAAGVVGTCTPTRYEVFEEELSQAAAEEACIFRGPFGKLSQADQRTVQEMINRVGLRTAWIGFHDQYAEAGARMIDIRALVEM